LIIEAHLEYVGEAWAVYDRRFRQIAVLHGDITWVRRDMDLWHTVFTGFQCRLYCKCFFSSTHSADQCCTTLMPALSETTQHFNPRNPRICREWNYLQCSFLGCCYIHACLACYTNPNSADSDHKWIQCHRNPKQHLEPPVPPQSGVPPLMGMPWFPY